MTLQPGTPEISKPTPTQRAHEQPLTQEKGVPIWERIYWKHRAKRISQRLGIDPNKSLSLFSLDEMAMLLRSSHKHLAELYRGQSRRVRQIEAHTPLDILLPTTKTLIHDTRTQEDVLDVLRNGLQVKNYGLQTSVDRLITKSEDQAKNISTGKSNITNLAGGGIHGNNFSVVMSFPEIMPPEVREAYEETTSLKDTWIENWARAKEQGLGQGEILAFFPSTYMTGVVDINTGQYYTKEQYLAAFGQSLEQTMQYRDAGNG